MSRQPQHSRRRRRPSIRRRIHAGGCCNVVGQEGSRHGRLCIEVGHPGGGHRHMMVVVEAGGMMVRGETCWCRSLMWWIDVRCDRGNGGRRGTVLGIPQAEELLDRERRALH